MDVTVRFAKEDDLDPLVSLWVEFMSNGFDVRSNLKMNDSNMKRWRSLAHISMIQKMVLVGESSGKLAGFILLNYGMHPFETYYKCAQILDLYVAPEFRGKGVGTKLLCDGLAHLKSLGYEAAVINVLAHNREALKLYEREGFDVVFHTMKKML